MTNGALPPRDTWVELGADVGRIPRGVVVLYGDDIGVVGSVVVEVDGEPVCRITPQEAQRTSDATMGRSTTSLKFTTGVEWRA
jgi:hypothetical protein